MEERFVTTGLFPVAQFPGGGPYTLQIFVSSFQETDATVHYSVNRVTEDGTKEVFRAGDIAVEAGGAARVTIEEIENQTLEVNLELPSDAVQAAVTLIGTFLADGATQTVLWASPKELVAPNGKRAEPREVTSGFFLVPDRPAAILPELQIFVSSFTDEDQVVPYVVNELREDGVKRQVDEGELNVAAGSTVQTALQPGFAGIVEVNLTLPVVGLVPSAAIVEQAQADESESLSFWISPGQFALQAAKQRNRDDRPHEVDIVTRSRRVRFPRRRRRR